MLGVIKRASDSLGRAAVASKGSVTWFVRLKADDSEGTR